MFWSPQYVRYLKLRSSCWLKMMQESKEKGKNLISLELIIETPHIILPSTNNHAKCHYPLSSFTHILTIMPNVTILSPHLHIFWQSCQMLLSFLLIYTYFDNHARCHYPLFSFTHILTIMPNVTILSSHLHIFWQHNKHVFPNLLIWQYSYSCLKSLNLIKKINDYSLF